VIGTVIMVETNEVIVSEIVVEYHDVMYEIEVDVM
jgi:hypothetical protein